MSKTNKRTNFGLIACLFFLALTSLACASCFVNADAPQANRGVSSCGVLSEPDTRYVLQTNVKAKGTCFKITGDNVELDCQNLDVTYATDVNGDGILVSGARSNPRVVVNNCKIAAGRAAGAESAGLRILTAQNSVIQNNNIRGVGYGVYLSGVTKSVFSNNRASASGSSGQGVYLVDSNANDFLENAFSSYGGTSRATGFYFKNSDNNKVADSQVFVRGLWSKAFRVEGSGVNHLVNVNGGSVKKDDVFVVSGATGGLNVYGYFSVTVKDGVSLEPLEGARVVIRDKDDSLVFDGNTNAEGKIPTQTILYYYRRYGGADEKNPHSFKTAREGYDTSYFKLNVEGNSGWTINLYPPAERILLTPREATITAGDSLAYVVYAFDARGRSWDVTGVSRYGIEPGAGGSWNYNHYISETAGEWHPRAEYSRFVDEVTLRVVPGEIASVVVEPNPATVYVGNQRQFTATCFDARSNKVSCGALAWHADSRIGRVDENGLFTAENVGEGEVTANTMNGVTDRARVTVEYSSISRITLQPDSLTIDPGYTQHFSAFCFNAYNDVVDCGALNWAASNGIGHFNQPEWLIADRVGTGAVTATAANGVSGTAPLKVANSEVKYVQLDSDNLNLHSGENHDFTALCVTNHNSVIECNVVWSVEGGVGSITQNGLFTAEHDGTGTVKTTAPNGVFGRARVFVSAAPSPTPNQIARVEVQPSSATVHTYYQHDFNADCFDAGGNLVFCGELTWSVTPNLGFVTEAGVFHANGDLGTGKVTAASNGVEGHAQVTVDAAPVARVQIAPDLVRVWLYSQQRFYALCFNADGILISCDYGQQHLLAWSADAGIGRITPRGLFTAEDVGRGDVTGTVENGISGRGQVIVADDSD